MLKTQEVAAPTVRLGGSGKQALLGGYCEVLVPLHKSIEAMHANKPHGRDYETTEALKLAQRQHNDRLSRVNSVIAELCSLSAVLQQWS